jgi:hypothetical protein
MTKNIPDEIQVAKLSIEAACTALESLFKRMEVMPRAGLQAAKDLLTRLETTPPGTDGA